MSLSGSGTCVCAWWTKGRTNLAFIGEQNFWRSSPLHSLCLRMTSSRILCTNTIQLFVDEWCKFWCRWYRFHILFIWFCHSFCPFFRQTTQTIHISLWNYNSECYIANCCCWPAFFCLRLTLPTLKCPCLFAYSLISWKNLTPWMNRINELGWVSFHTIVHIFFLVESKRYLL